MDFEIIGEIKKIRLIADKKRIRILPYLIKSYGKGNWKKLSGEASVLDYLDGEDSLPKFIITKLKESVELILK